MREVTKHTRIVFTVSLCVALLVPALRHSHAGIGDTGRGGQQDPNPGGGDGIGGGDGFGPIIDGCFLLIPPDGVGFALAAPPWPYPSTYEELNIEQKIELFGNALIDPGSAHHIGKREIKRQLREFRAKNYPAASYMTTAPTSGELNVIKEIRKPAWNEPGGWGYEGFGPEGAAYELIAVAAGGAAVARGTLRTGPAPQNLPTALVPEVPSVVSPTQIVGNSRVKTPRPLGDFPVLVPGLSSTNKASETQQSKEVILRRLNDDIVRPTTLRRYRASVSTPMHPSPRTPMRSGDFLVRVPGISDTTNAPEVSRRMLFEIEQAGNRVVIMVLAGGMTADQVSDVREAGYIPMWLAPYRDIRSDLEKAMNPSSAEGMYLWAIHTFGE